MLTLFGAHDVAILDGGIAKWKAEGRKCAQGRETLRHRHFTVWKDEKAVRNKADMLANLHSKEADVVDAAGLRLAQHLSGAADLEVVHGEVKA
jgi:thiosulfate/3-mercaptopyruvate sulfurtransferase